MIICYVKYRLYFSNIFFIRNTSFNLCSNPLRLKNLRQQSNYAESKQSCGGKTHGDCSKVEIHKYWFLVWSYCNKSIIFSFDCQNKNKIKNIIFLNYYINRYIYYVCIHDCNDYNTIAINCGTNILFPTNNMTPWQQHFGDTALLKVPFYIITQLDNMKKHLVKQMKYFFKRYNNFPDLWIDLKSYSHPFHLQ